MLLLTTYIYDPDPLTIILGLSVYLVPAAILWGIAKSLVLSPGVSQVIQSISLGLISTAILVGLSIFLATGTIEGHYHLFDVSKFDPMFWMVRYLGLTLASVVSTLLFSLISLLVLKKRNITRQMNGSEPSDTYLA